MTRIDVHVMLFEKVRKQCILTDPLFWKKMCVSEKEYTKMLESG